MRNNLNANFLEKAVCELDRMAVEEAIKRRCYNPHPTALVLPGRCELALELARKGILVTASDLGDLDDEALKTQLGDTSSRSNLRFDKLELGQITHKLHNQPFDLAVCRRGICAMPYPAARDAVRQLLKALKIGGRLYLSVLGLHSELGHRYPGTEAEVNARFCELDPKVSDKYGITGPVCLYTERNLFTLILEAGGSVLRTFTTTHGNVKGIAVRV